MIQFYQILDLKRVVDGGPMEYRKSSITTSLFACGGGSRSSLIKQDLFLGSNTQVTVWNFLGKRGDITWELCT